MNDLPPGAQAIAERRAAEDRETLARLLREGKVKRASAPLPDVPGAGAFVRDIQQRADPHRGINLAIKPKKGKHRR